MSVELEKPVPQDETAERLVLGCALSGSNGHSAVFDLRPEEFFHREHQTIFRAMLVLHADGKPTDLLAVHDELQRSGELSKVSIEKLAGLVDGIPVVFNVAFHVGRVKDKARMRAVIHTTREIYDAAFLEADAAALADLAIEKFSEIARDAEADRNEGTSYGDAAGKLLQELDEDSGVRIFTDIEKLDLLTGGFRAGELVVYCAETGVGKTLLAQQTRRRACRDGRHTLFCSGEMRAPHLVSRELATAAGVEHWKMRRQNRLTPEDMRELVRAASHECDLCRILDGELSLSRIRRVARAMKAQSGLDLIVLDYDELIEAPGKDELEQQRVLARGAKSMAVELSCPVLLISQLRKPLNGEDVRRPTLQRLYGSGAKAKHASVILFVDRPYVRELEGDETVAHIAVVKNRDGRVGFLDCVFNIRTLRFDNAPLENAETGTPTQPERPRYAN